MRWSPVIWFLLSCTIFASTVIEAKREKRDLSMIKKFLISSFLGCGRKKCTGRTSHRKPAQRYNFFIVPERERFVIEREREKEKTYAKEVEASESSNENFLFNSIRQLLDSGVIHETSEALRSLIFTLQGATNDQETDNSIEDNSQDQQQYVSTDILQINQNLLPIVHAPERILSYKMDYGRQQIPSVFPSIARFVSPIVSMPRKYSYEQAKGDTIETFTLDKNSNVIVTERRNPQLPRPVYINDRIKELILCAPLDLKNDNKHYESALVKSKISQKVLTSNPYNDDILTNDNLFIRQVNGLERPLIYQNTRDLQTKTMTQTFRKDAGSPVLISKANVGNGMLQQYLNTVHKLANVNKGTSVRQNQLHDKPNQIFGDSTPSISVQEILSKTLDKEKNIANNAANSIQTRYKYKQETKNGLFQYDKTANISVGQDGNNIVLKMVPDDNVSDYAGKPIIVGSLDNNEEVINSILSTSNSRIKGEGNKTEPRGDIPE